MLIQSLTSGESELKSGLLDHLSCFDSISRFSPQKGSQRGGGTEGTNKTKQETPQPG